MTRKCSLFVRLGCLVGCLAVVAGCPQKPQAGEVSLGMAAFQTHTRYVKAINAGRETWSDDIDSEYWTKEIRSLHPIRVYLHRSNVVVVQEEWPGREEGKYINIIISSYLPQSGVDGFTLTEIGTGVYDFTRILET